MSSDESRSIIISDIMVGELCQFLTYDGDSLTGLIEVELWRSSDKEFPYNIYGGVYNKYGIPRDKRRPVIHSVEMKTHSYQRYRHTHDQSRRLKLVVGGK